MKKLYIIIIILAVLVLGGSAVFATSDEKINICHATSSEKNPYEAISVSAKNSGHENHEADFAYAGEVDKNGKPTKDGDDWCKKNAPKPTPTYKPTPKPTVTPTVTEKPTVTPVVTPTAKPSTTPTPEPTIDLCNNLDGVQTTVPKGYNWEKDNCYEIPPFVPEPLPVNPDTGKPYIGK
jgi:hypothetical protein